MDILKYFTNNQIPRYNNQTNPKLQIKNLKQTTNYNNLNNLGRRRGKYYQYIPILPMSNISIIPQMVSFEKKVCHLHG
jgi:hypothetical protein